MSKHPKGPRSKSPDSYNRKNDRQEQKCLISGEIGVVGQIEANLSRELLEEYKTSNSQTNTREQQRDRRDSSRFRVEIITLGFVIFVAILSLIQAQESVRTANAAAEANRLSKANFWSDQRPYIGTRLVEPLPNIRPDIHDIPIGYFDYKNFGKGPALHVKVASWLFTGENRISEVDAWFSQLGTTPLTEETTKALMTFGEPQKQRLWENIEMPNQEIRAVSVGVNSYPDGWDGNGLIAGRIEYFDISGNRYWTDTCWSIVRNVPKAPDWEVAMRCASHNDVH